MSEQTPRGGTQTPRLDQRYYGRNRVDGADARASHGCSRPEGRKKESTFARLKTAAADRSAEKREAKEAQERKWAAEVAAAGALVTSGTFGLSTIEVYEGGYVRVRVR